MLAFILFKEDVPMLTPARCSLETTDPVIGLVKNFNEHRRHTVHLLLTHVSASSHCDVYVHQLGFLFHGISLSSFRGAYINNHTDIAEESRL